MVSLKEIEKILDVKFTLPDGKLAAVIIENKELSNLYDCVLCSVHQLNFHNLIGHVSGRKHKENVDLVDIDTGSKSTAPRYAGKNSTLQATINEIRNEAIIGLEYILDIQSMSDSKPTYRCFLCKQTFVRETQVVNHLKSFEHRLNYLENIFPKVFEEVSYLIDIICEGVEDQFGRSKLTMLESSEYFKNKTKFTKIGSSSKRMHKNIDCLQLIGKSVGIDKNDCKSQEKCANIVSISSDTSSDSNSQSGSSSNVTSSSSSSVTAIEPDREDKLKKFRLQLSAIKNELLTAYQPYITNPNSYPGYFELWSSFWIARNRELRGDDKLKTYNWQSEWSAEWTRIINKKLKMEFELKCSEVKRTLGIAESHLSATDENTTQPTKPITSVSPRKSRSPCRSRSASRSRSLRRSRTPRRCPAKVVSPRRSRSPQRSILSPFSGKQNLDQNRSSQVKKTATVLPTIFLNKCQTPLRLEQLLELHKNNADFLISWRELLRIFEIDDNGRSMNEAKCPSPQVFKDATDSSEKITDQMERNERSATVQEQAVEAVESVTVISVLSVLTALEDVLGSFGPKLIHLLQKAIAMDKSTTGFSNSLLDDSHNCILFETIKEKLKGLLAVGLIDPNLQNVVRRSIKDMTDLVDRTKERKTKCSVQTPSTPSVATVPPHPEISTNAESLLRPAEKEDDSKAADNEAVTLNDSEIKTLMAKFTTLSEEEKSNFTVYLEGLHLNDPDRVTRLKNEFGKSQIPLQIAIPERKERMYNPGEVVYSEHTENAATGDEDDETTSMAYRVAKNNPGVRIKRRAHNENDGFWMDVDINFE